MTCLSGSYRRSLRACAALSFFVIACADGAPTAATEAATTARPATHIDDDAAHGEASADVRTPATQEAPPQGVPSPALPEAGRRPIASGLTVDTDEGPVLGQQLGNTRAFLGIPFAKAPAGALRWRPPAPPAPRTAPFEARKYGPICPQELPVLGLDGRSQEDCLNLNVWAPRTAPTERLPVMVWIHGGSFTMGSGGDQYDGQKLASNGSAIIVTINYRLGALGFIAHEKLTAESGTSGNYGIMDQRAALLWVRRNISAFGGDPDNVTLFGESAGGNSVCVHLVSPQSRGLFHKAIAQSGLCMKQTMVRKDAEMGGARLQRDLGCGSAADPLACMRAAPVRTVLEKSRVDGTNVGGAFYVDYANALFVQPIVDGVVVPDQIPRLLEEGALHKVPVLHGATADEGVLFQSALMGSKPVQNEAQFRAAVAIRFPTFVDAIAQRYAPPKTPSWNEALARATGDSFFVCSARRMSQRLHAQGVPSYLYRFAGPLDSLLAFDVSGRAIHGADIPYVFGNPFPLGTIPGKYRALANAVPGYWLRFAKAGDPNGAEGPRWSPDDPASGDEFTLDATIAVRPRVPAECAFWDEVASAEAAQGR